MDLFKVHLENTRALDKAFEIISRQCKNAVARQDQDEIDALTKTCAFLLGARMENRLLRLLYEDGAFDTGARDRILDQPSIEKSWLRLIDEAFAARRNLRPSAVPRRLDFTDAGRRNELVRIIREDLGPLITLRNTLAHGQWHRTLNSERTRISKERMQLLNTTRIWHLIVKANLLDHLVKIIHDLAVTQCAFERDFDKRWEDLSAASRRLKLGRFAAWEAQLIRKYTNRPKVQTTP